MAFCLRKRTDLVRKIERLREVLETKDPLQPADPIAFDDLPLGDLRLQFRDFFLRDSRRIGTTRGACRFLQRTHARNITRLAAGAKSSLRATLRIPETISIFQANPCGEVPLLPYEACNLGSINLAHMIAERGGRFEIAWEKLRATVHTATRFLDDVVEANKHPIPEIEHMVRGNRKIGLGVMGFAEMLIRLGVSYDSDEAVAVGERVMKFIDDE